MNSQSPGGIEPINLSNIAVARIMEQKMATSPIYRKRIAKSGRPTASAMRKLGDEQVVEMLSKLGLQVRKENFAELAGPFMSAEKLAGHLFPTRQTDTPSWGADRVWLGLSILWERWLPHRPSFEMLDDWMQAGYDLSIKPRDAAGACEKWLRVWSALLHIMDSTGRRSLGEFDQQFRGTQLACNWVQDLEGELWNAGLGDRLYWERGIEFTTEYLARFAEEEPLIAENMRRALATFHAGLGQAEQADELFRGWLQLDPNWGWGWIGWSECYYFTPGERDSARAERLILDGLDWPEVRDRRYLLERLESLYLEQGRENEAAEVHSKIHALRDGTNHEVFERQTPAKSTKVGRNVPCPCGSGRKFKKCCGSVVQPRARARSRPRRGGEVMKKKKRKTQRGPTARVSRVSWKLSEGLNQAEDLMRREEWSEALDRLKALDRRFPGQPEVLASLADTYYELDDMVHCMGACERLVRADASDPAFWQSLAGAYAVNRFPALALRTFRRVLGRAPEDDRAGEWRRIVGELETMMRHILVEFGLDGPDGERQSEQHEEVQVALALGHYAQARRLGQELLLRHPRFAPALNNITQAYAAEGRFNEAIATAQRVLALEPENVHALSNLTRCQVLLGRLDEARSFADRLLASKASASEGWLKKAEALAHLGDDARTIEVFDGAELERQADDPMLLHLTAVAALRLGRESEARTHWKRTLKLRPGFELARGNLEDLALPVGERDAPWAYPLNHWVSDSTAEDLRRQFESRPDDNDDRSRAKARRFLQQHPEWTVLVPILLDRGDPPGRSFALMLAELAGTPELTAAARDYALGQRGPDAARMRAAILATEAGLLPSGPTRMWLKGMWKEIALQGIEVNGEASVSYEHEPQAARWMREAILAMHEDDTERAEKLLKRALELEPDKPDLLNNLAVVYSRTGRVDEAMALTERVLALDPDYLFARTTMARRAARQGDTQKARALLQPLLARPRLHPTELAALASAQVELHSAEGDPEGALGWLKAWEEAYPEDPVLESYRRDFRETFGHSRGDRWRSFFTR